MNFTKIWSRAFVVALGLLFGASLGFAQATGSIQGSALDPSGASVPGVVINVRNVAVGVQRTIQTNDTGLYVVSALAPGDYEVTAEITGFTKIAKRVTLSAGGQVTVDFELAVGQVNQTIDVTSDAPEINLVNSKVEANINPMEIAQLPLIGRNAYELAKLSPAVIISSAPGRNNDISISIIGRATTSTRVTLNGLDISNVMAGGEPQMNFSQELVQEFQVAINNGDPANGNSSSGTINLVTKRGGNVYHGAGYGYFRNSQYAGFPGISHPAVLANPNNDPNIAAYNNTNASPNFFRRVYGGILSGPIRRDSASWLVSGERTEQESAAVYNPNFTAFNSAFSTVGTVPSDRITGSVRLDWQANPNNSFYFMTAVDRLRQTTNAAGSASQAAYRNNNVYFTMLGWTKVFNPNFVGDFRLGFDYYDQVTLNTKAAQDIAKLVAAGTGLDTIGSFSVSGTNLSFGGRTDSPQEWRNPRVQFSGNFTYSQGPMTWRFGVMGEPTKFRWLNGLYSTPMTGTIFNPTQAAAAGIPIPATFNTYADLLQLPLSTFTFAVGNQIVYPDFWNTDKLLWIQIYSGYVGSSYKVTPRLTANWNVLYSYNGGTPNFDLPLPASVGIFTGGDLSAPKKSKDDFSPSFGISWDPFGHGKTVIRGGTGYYYGIVSPSQEGRNRANLIPVGNGFATVSGTAITNTKTGVGTLNFSTASANAAAGVYRLQDLVNNISTIKANLLSTVFTGTNTNFAVTNTDYFKGETTGIYTPDFHLPVSWQSMIGMQQRFGNDWLIGVSYVYDVTNHEQFSYDANLSNRLSVAKGGPGPVKVGWGQVVLDATGGRSVYKALLVDARKSFSHHYVLNAAYTHQSAEGTVFTGQTPPALINLTNRADNWGPFASIPSNTFSLGVSATGLPWGFELSLVNYIQSKLPFNPTLSGVDITGDGTTNDHLPEIAYNSVNRGCDKSCLIAAVADFNTTYAGKLDANKTAIPTITLPANFKTGDGLMTQDIRVTKKFHVTEQVNLSLQAEMFNVMNWANLNFASSAGNVYSTGFGQPTDRSATNFGSGAPRSMQFGLRVGF